MRDLVSVGEQIKGATSEIFFLSTMVGNRYGWPDWLLEVRRADKRDDRRGIDAFATTRDMGDIHIQIKNSMGGAVEYVKKHRFVSYKACIFILEGDEEADEKRGAVYRRAMRLLERFRENELRKVKQKFLVSGRYGDIICHLA